MPPPLVDALTTWVEAFDDNLESVWSVAGRSGGGGLLDVDSLEELDQVMIRFPFGPSVDIEIMALVGLGHSMERTKAPVEGVLAMMKQ